MSTRLTLSVLVLAVVPIVLAGQQPPRSTDQTSESTPETSDEAQRFVFRTGVNLINVTATVTDARGRFVSGLTQADFTIYEDGEEVDVTQFSNERVPVSLGIALDTSGSMEGRKMDAARSALDRFLYDLLAPDDELFLYEFNYTPDLLQDWTTDRDRISRALRGIRPRGGTALYDAVAESVPRVEEGQHVKKALLIISDGNDTNSETDVRALRERIRDSEALVYAIGIDGDARRPGWTARGRSLPMPSPGRVPSPFPFPGGGRRAPQMPGGRTAGGNQDDRVNLSALRDLTDDSGGRTEIVRDIGDLEPATAGIARELSQQYYLGYPSQAEPDGRWHAIRVEVRDSAYRVRARRGYTALP